MVEKLPKRTQIKFFILAFLVFVWPMLGFADSLSVISSKLNGQDGNTNFNAVGGKEQPLLIEIVANQPVKFNTIAICLVTESSCSRSTAVKYFTQTDLSSSVSKPWDGKTGGSNPQVVADGEYKIMVTMSLFSGGESVSQEISPHIIVVSSVVETAEDNQNSTTTASSVTASIVSGGGSYSSHSSQTDLSTGGEISPNIGAGRKRLVSTNMSVSFRVEKGRGLNQSGRFVWSFGDGSFAEGESVEHLYRFAGQYNVILNGYFDQGQAVSRTKVEVTDPQVEINAINQKGGFIEISNHSKQEVNIGNWILRGKNIYQLPNDTIIDGDQKIKIPFDLFGGLDDWRGVSLVRSEEKLAGSNFSTSTMISQLEKIVSDLKSQLSLIDDTNYNSVLTSNKSLSSTLDTPPSEIATSTRIILRPKLSWWQKLITIGR